MIVLPDLPARTLTWTGVPRNALDMAGIHLDEPPSWANALCRAANVLVRLLHPPGSIYARRSYIRYRLTRALAYVKFDAELKLALHALDGADAQSLWGVMAPLVLVEEHIDADQTAVEWICRALTPQLGCTNAERYAMKQWVARKNRHLFAAWERLP